MKPTTLLHVVRLTLRSNEQIASALRDAYLARERAKIAGKVLFFCDLEDADAQALPADAERVRFLQSGVMSMAARRPGEYDFLVRARRRDETLRRWLGKDQTPGVRETLFRLLSGERVPPFEAASLSLAALRGAFDVVLITDAALRFPPDAPLIMLDALDASGRPALRGGIVIPQKPEEPIFARLERAGFSLLPALPGMNAAVPEPPAAIYAPEALLSPPPGITQDDPPIFLANADALSDHLDRARVAYARGTAAQAIIPIAQLALLFLSALTGFTPFALAAILAPELAAVLSLGQLPCALVRLVFLPRSALLAVNALIARRCRGKKLLPSLSCGSGACVVFGGALLVFALRGANSLPLLLLVGLLWLAAPLIERALPLPARERIPLSADERARLVSLAKSAFYTLPQEDESPTALLAACAGCMLGVLEPDEAARRAENMLPRLAIRSAFDHACVHAAAQFFSDRMAQCDAALRSLPAQLEAAARSAPPIDENSLLAALLSAARERANTPHALARLRAAGPGRAMDALFLSPGPLPQTELFLPLTHPHTFLLRAGAQKSDPLPPEEEANRFLTLACAALHAPFHALFMRSSAVAPYAPLIDLR